VAKVRYYVRALKDGDVVLKETFKRKNKALDFIERQIDKGRSASIRKVVSEGRFTIEGPDVWGRSAHNPYETGPKPVGTVFFHTSVTTQLSPAATAPQERAEMRKLDAIAKGRGFNGISYSVCIFPSGRAYYGRGWGVVEAATEGYNTTSDSVCFAGNTDSFPLTRAQKDAAVQVLRQGQLAGFLTVRGLSIRGHREVAAKACPGRHVSDDTLRAFERAVA
jgi:hypothetical protein